MIGVLAFLFLIIDLVSKMVVIKYMNLNQSISVVGDFLNLTYVRNTGAAWSILDDNSYVVLGISIIIIIGIILFISKNKVTKMYEKLAYALILGGAIGNFVNRVIFGYVIDFIDIRIFRYDYPIFNLADIFIVLGVIVLVIVSWRENDGNYCK